MSVTKKQEERVRVTAAVRKRQSYRDWKAVDEFLTREPAPTREETLEFFYGVLNRAHVYQDPDRAALAYESLQAVKQDHADAEQLDPTPRLTRARANGEFHSFARLIEDCRSMALTLAKKVDDYQTGERITFVAGDPRHGKTMEGFLAALAFLVQAEYALECAETHTQMRAKGSE